MYKEHLTIHKFTPEALLGPLNEVEAKRAPKELFVAGDAGLFQGKTLVSVVGSRKASDQGIGRAKRIARLLARASRVIFAR